MYTVQIGAFARAANALRFEKQARGRYPDLPVSNRFDKSDRLYRVSVGVFGTKREASALRRSMREQYPKEYHDAWVIYTSR
jgi:cell division septation protein DedD